MTMRSLLRPRSLCALLVVVLLSVAAVWFFLLRKPADIRAFSSIRSEWLNDREADAWTRGRRAEQCLEIARQLPDTVGGLSALFLASTSAGDTPAGKEAQEQLAEQIGTADIGKLAAALDRNFGRWRAIEPLAPALLDRAKKAP